ncbi:RNA polymerase sigma factor [Phycicoccus sp. BSK3Z-2]|uniref:RNA polymerase sigma factor n=1 Tax=Phycicoccus avicenniae TaxID=2828860 RepID=A0A941I0N4_9MICO|nr:RNA polymerase sigma factor [Phycicoccus avicenniae]MBR7744292.1 RNA polymerase sigma factor [Phycicoccus avicenniae]
MTPTVEEVHRAEFGRVVAALAGRFGDLDLAEECTQEAFVEAVRRWPEEGTPPNPGGWLTVVARNKALDRLRRESTRQARHEEAHVLHDASHDTPGPPSSVVDDRLRLLFTCCHPALAPEARVALTLRLLGGLTVPEVARAFLVEERTMAQRITRAKRKIAAARIPYRVPSDAELPDRLPAVLAVVYLVFTEGHLPGDGAEEVRADLTGEAIRLGRLLRTLMPDEPEVAGLLALMLLTEARRAARFDGGRLVPLAEQDRSLWDAALVAEGHALVRECLRRNRPGHHQLVAAVNAVHTDAATAADTDWRQVVALYDRMLVATPTPVVTLNRAVAVAEVDGPAAGLALVDDLPGLDGYHPFHATRADLLRRLGRRDEALAAYDRALGLATNPGERAFLTARRTEVVDGP